MPQRQSSLPRSTILPLVTEVQALTDSILATRKPSWTVFPEPEARGTPNSLSRSRHSFRVNDEHPTPGLSVDWRAASSSLSSTHRPPFEPAAASTPDVSHPARNPQLEEQGDVSPEILHSPEGKEFRSSWEINVKKLVGDAVGNVNLNFHVERSRYLINATSLDEYKSYFARHRSGSVCRHLCSCLLSSTNNVIGEEDSSSSTLSHDSAFLAFSLKVVLGTWLTFNGTLILVTLSISFLHQPRNCLFHFFLSLIIDLHYH
jgi:hypothetical protein